MNVQPDRRGIGVANAWEPMRLSYVGSIGELMQTSTVGSTRDGTLGCGTTRKRTAPPAGTAC